MRKIYYIYVLIIAVSVGCSKSTDVVDGDSGKKGGDNGNNNEQEWLSPVKSMTYNIEYTSVANTETNPWSSRKELVKEIFDKYSPDIVGVQELSKAQLDDMVVLMPRYAFVGTDVRGETTVNNRLSVTIFYKKENIEIKEWGKFWLSETPAVAGKGWDADQFRICTWAHVKDKNTQKEFYFFSTHLDHIGTEARTKSVQLLLDTIPVMTTGYPAILTGDFNSAQTTTYYKLMVSGNNIKDTYDLTNNKTNALRGTFNDYDVNKVDNRRIDHIFLTTTMPVKVDSWAVRTDIFNGKYPSDHFPVITEIRFSK